MPLSASAIDDLVAAYSAARAETDRAARFGAGDATLPMFRCRYCGGHRARIQVSAIDGHAKCVVTPAFMLRVLALAEAGVTAREVELALGVSAGVIRAWWQAALDARAEERARATSRGELAGLEPWVRLAIASGVAA